MKNNKDQLDALPQPIPYEEEDEKDELEEFFFFRQLEKNEGRPTRAMFKTGCFTILPLLAAIVLGLFLFLRYMYL